MTWHWLRLAIPINPAAKIESQPLINFPGVLSKAADVMARTFPNWIVESLPIEERQIQIQILERVQLYSGRSRRSRGKGSAIRHRHRQRDRVGGASLELPFAGEPEIIPEIVTGGTIRPAKLECMGAPQPGDVVLELIAILRNLVRSAKSTARSLPGPIRLTPSRPARAGAVLLTKLGENCARI